MKNHTFVKNRLLTPSCVDTFVNYTDTYTASPSSGSSPYTYNWTVTGGNPDGSTTDASVRVSWETSGKGKVEVSVTDSNGKTGTQTLDVNVYKLKGKPLEIVGSVERTELGVGEDVYLYAYLGHSPKSGFVWSVVSGDATCENTDLVGTLNVGASAGDITVRATKNGAWDDLSFTSIQPESLDGEKSGEDDIAYAEFPALCEATMSVKLTLKPTSVSFKKLEIIEDHYSDGTIVRPPNSDPDQVGDGNIATRKDHPGAKCRGAHDEYLTIPCSWAWQIPGKSSWVEFPNSTIQMQYVLTGIDDDNGVNDDKTIITVSKFGATVTNNPNTD